jgi:PilZ domain
MPTERRKNPRLGLAIPMRVQGFYADATTWDEMTSSLDVSQGGACFALSHDAELGQVLLLSLALPKRLRQYDLTDAVYRVYSLVRSVRRRGEQPRVGVMFFGKHPPRGFSERPGARFLLPSDSIVNAVPPAGLRDGNTPYAGLPALPRPAGAELPPFDSRVGANGSTATTPDPDASGPGRYTPPPMTANSTIPKGRPATSFLNPETGISEPSAPSPSSSERRAHSRSEVFVNFTIQLVDEWGVVLQEELTVADNVGRGGARVMTTLTFQLGDVVLLQEAGGGFATRAQVRAVTRSQPTIERLHLQFLDRQAPDRLLRQ